MHELVQKNLYTVDRSKRRTRGSISEPVVCRVTDLKGLASTFRPEVRGREDFLPF